MPEIEAETVQLDGELGRSQLAALIEASKLLNATLDREEVLRQLMALAARGVDADRATLYLLDKARRELRSIVAAAGVRPGRGMGAAHSRRQSFSAGLSSHPGGGREGGWGGQVGPATRFR